MSALLWKKIQSFLRIIADGIPGDQTAYAVAAKLGLISQAPTFDSRSESNISTLVPSAQAKAREWLVRCRAEGINVKVICGLRNYEEQAELYAHGRTKPGPKVTNAMPGYSWHNFGVAWDFVVFDANGQPLWDSPLMERCGVIGEELGLEWGGRWKSPEDKPHLQLKTGLTLAQARQLQKNGERIA
jgi:peptidoglycan L-alanyl-D-glutamate endopeptidase CwlK